MPTDTAKDPKKLTGAVWESLAMFLGICCCLLAFHFPWGYLGGLGGPWGVSGGIWVVFMEIGGAWICLGGIRVLNPCSMEWKHYFGTALNGTVFCQLTILRHQNTKTAAYKLAKNDWVRPFFAIFRFIREILFVTVAFDHPVSFYHLTTFTFTQLPKWFLTSSWHCVRQRLQKGKVFTTLIFCLLKNLIYLPISLSLLETGQRNSRFLFLLSKLEKGIQVSLSPLETGQENSRFLFLLSRRGKGIRISLSPLECGEIVFKFLFLFSIGLFCISSMTLPSPPPPYCWC